MSLNAAELAPPPDRRIPVRFFLAAQLALLLFVLVGFTPTFYLRPLFKTHALPAVLYLHGSVLTGWFMLAALQAWLMHTRRGRSHRQLGYLTAGYAVLVVAMGLVAIVRMASGIVSPRDPENIIVWGNLFSLLLFVSFVTLALILRKQPEYHKRLILLASISIVGPALARFSEWSIFPGGMAARPLYGAGGLLLLYATLLGHDLITRRRPHPASWIGVLAVLLCSAAAIALAVSGKGFAIMHRGVPS